jgi:hypothetical protein
MSNSSTTRPVVARHLFGLSDFKFQAFSSGDSLSDYSRFFIYAVIAILVTIVWSLRDRKTTNHSRLNQWLRLFAQFVVAISLFVYGFAKVIPHQFGELTPSRLLAPVGGLRPFDMLWLFMAASKPYTIFSGSVEVLAARLST